MREAVSVALVSSHLEPVQEREVAIDRIGALGRATKLGRSLWHWKLGLDDTAGRSALKHLLRKAQRRVRIYKHHREFGLLVKMCKAALNEWHNPLCKTCGGAREFSNEEQKLVITCHVCSGTGLHRYSDTERAIALGLDPEAYRFVDRRFSEVMLCLRGCDSGTSYKCREQLERG